MNKKNKKTKMESVLEGALKDVFSEIEKDLDKQYKDKIKKVV